MSDRTALTSGKPRVGVVFFERGGPGLPAMVFDNGEVIELTVNIDRGEPVARRFSGRSVSYGDDPEYKLHDYSMPTQVWFQDPHGVICLVEPRGRSLSFTTLQEGRLRFAYAIAVGGVGIRYDRINAMQSRIEGLDEWIPISSIEHEYIQENGSPNRSVFSVRHQPPVNISRKLNAQILPSYSFSSSPVPGKTELADEMRVKTSASRARPWQEHLDVHRGVRDLLVVAGWRDYGTWNLSVSRVDDPERALAGNSIGDSWARVSTYAMSKGSGTGHSNRFLFDFADVGAQGLGRWLRLRQRHRRGIAGMIHSVGMSGVALETSISEAGAALEYLGYGIAVERSEKPGRHLATHLRRVAGQSECDMGIDLDTWPNRFADAYNTVKHPDRPKDWDTLDLHNVLREARLVFRTWVARRLGASVERLEQNYRIVPMSRPYELV